MPEPDMLVYDESTRLLLDAVPEPILIVDANGLIVDANLAAHALFETPIPQMIGSPGSHYVTPAATQFSGFTFESLIPGKPSQRPVPCLIKRRNGSPRPCEVSVAPLPTSPNPTHWMTLIRDTSTRSPRELRERETIRQDTIQYVLKHVANPFNNALASVSGLLENTLNKLDPHAALATELSVAQHEIRKAARVIRQLHALANPEAVRLTPIDPRTLIDDCMTGVQGEFEPNVLMQTHCDHDDWLVSADRQGITDLLITLVTQARDQLGGKGGTVAVSCRARRAGEGPKTSATLENVDYVHIGVDSRPSPSERSSGSRHRSPKPTSTDHRLGMEGAGELLARHGGALSVDQGADGGVSADIFLPKLDHAEPIGPPSTQPLTGTETVLVIDDEASVRRIVRKTLELHGYTVIDASSGDQGLALLDKQQTGVQLVILDVLMPTMSGWDVLEALQRRPTPPPVILQSGYTAADDPARAGAARAFLRKPYELSELVRTVRDVLDTN